MTLSFTLCLSSLLTDAHLFGFGSEASNAQLAARDHDKSCNEHSVQQAALLLGTEVLVACCRVRRIGNQCVHQVGHQQNKTGPLLSRDQRQGAEAVEVAEDHRDLLPVGVQAPLLGHRVGELFHDKALGMLVPPGLKVAIR